MVRKETDKNESLQVLRCFAFLGIFICHTGLNGFQSLGGWGVSVFIVLSGFLMTYNYWGKDRIKKISLIENIKFATKKISKLYLLHILMMLAMLVFSFLGERTESISKIILKIVLNVFLVQEWFPLADREINGMSWFLCIMLFLYFVFPWINKLMERNYCRKKAYIMMSFSFVIVVVIGVFANIIGLSWWNYLESSVMVDDITRWIIYYFPVSRFWEFFIGCNLGYIFLNKEIQWDEKKCSLFEILAIVLVVISNVMYMQYATPNVMNAGTGVERTEKWWMFVLVFVVSTAILVYSFAIGKGVISKVLNCRIVLLIAKLSPFAFLIHTVVFRYLSIIYYHIPNIDGEWFYYTYGRWINLTLGFVITIVVSWVWSKISVFFKNQFKI